MSTLAELSLGSAGRVLHVTGHDEIALRLLEMGLTPGTEVRLLAMAPLGDPVELLVRGYHLSVRRSEASRVAIEPLS